MDETVTIAITNPNLLKSFETAIRYPSIKSTSGVFLPFVHGYVFADPRQLPTVVPSEIQTLSNHINQINTVVCYQNDSTENCIWNIRLF